MILLIVFALPASADTPTQTPAIPAGKVERVLASALPLWVPVTKVNATLSQVPVERRGLFHVHLKKEPTEFRWGATVKLLGLWILIVLATSIAFGQQGGVAQVPVVEHCVPTLDHPHCTETWIAPRPFVVADSLTPHVEPEKPLKPITKPPIHGNVAAVVKRPLNVVGKCESVVAHEVDKAGTSACIASASCADHHADNRNVNSSKLVKVR
jgi:hypothetical protein